MFNPSAVTENIYRVGVLLLLAGILTVELIRWRAVPAPRARAVTYAQLRETKGEDRRTLRDSLPVVRIIGDVDVIGDVSVTGEVAVRPKSGEPLVVKLP